MTRMRTLMTAQDVAERLKIKPKTVYNMAAAGTIPCVRIGERTVRFDPERLDQWIREQS